MKQKIWCISYVVVIIVLILCFVNYVEKKAFKQITELVNTQFSPYYVLDGESDLRNDEMNNFHVDVKANMSNMQNDELILDIYVEVLSDNVFMDTKVFLDVSNINEIFTYLINEESFMAVNLTGDDDLREKTTKNDENISLYYSCRFVRSLNIRRLYTAYVDNINEELLKWLHEKNTIRISYIQDGLTVFEYYEVEIELI
jgi:hypothetical protein